MELVSKPQYVINLNKDELSIISKALTGVLKASELERAHQMGVSLLGEVEKDHVARAELAKQAAMRAVESPPAKG